MLRVASFLIGASSLALAAVGCGEGAIRPPSFSPSSVSAAALKEFDENGNDLLEASELARAPGLWATMQRSDTDSNGTLTKDEIAARIESYRASGIGLMPFTCTIYLDEQPLSGAVVKLVPEPFLASTIKPAAANSSETGVAAPVIEGEEFPSLQCGMYRVEISKKDAGGVETVPAKYNSSTELGQEIAADVPGLERNVSFHLSSN